MDTTTKVTSEKPLVSIIMPTYNRSAFMSEAILSVQKQTYQNWELIVIDDGSTDNTAKVVADFQEKRIRYIHNKTNKGLIARRLESLGYTNGSYVAILDSDDTWTSPDKLTEQVQYMTDNPLCAVIGTYITLIDDNGVVSGKTQYNTTDKDIRRHLLFRNQFTHSSVLMRSSSLSHTQGYRDTTLAEDYDLFLQLGQYGTFANLPEHYTAYRIHDGSENHKRLMMAQAVLRIVQSHKGEYPNYYLALIKCYVRIIFTWLTQKLKSV
jgi:glycosyltransferase involved in cell wall biosynthesis